MDAGLPSGTVTFLFSDIEGSTELSRRHGAAYGDLRAEHRRVLREAFEIHDGREIDAEGDAFFIAFERATDAVAAAVAVQRALAAEDTLRVRIGLHTTEPHLHPDGYVGVGVSRGARICAAAHGGQIVLSASTAGIVEDGDLGGVRLRDLGEHLLKDLSLPQRLFQIEADGLPTEFPPPGAKPAASAIATLVAIDLAGWRRVMDELGDDGGVAAATEYHRIVAAAARANGGMQVERAGDRSLSVFSSPKGALLAVAAVQAELQNRDWIPLAEKPELQAAVHTGRVRGLVAGQLGSSAFRVIQLCGAADSGQILVSHSTHALLEGELLGELRLRDLGERTLPGIAPMHVYALENPRASS